MIRRALLTGAIASLVQAASAQQIDRYCSNRCFGEASYCSKSCPPQGQEFQACGARCAGQKQACMNACPLEKPPQPYGR